MQLIRFVNGLENQICDILSHAHFSHFTSHGTRCHRPVDTEQSHHQLSLSCLSLGPQVSPPTLCASSSPLRASLPRHINYSLSPVAPAPPSVTPGVTESAWPGVVLPLATPDISQKFLALFLQPCSATPTRPSGSQGGTGIPLGFSQQWSVPQNRLV